MLLKLAKILSYINANPDRDLTLDNLARLAKMSRSRLRHLFKADNGTSLGKYVKTLRMQKAAKLLKTTALTIQEIREKVGMRDQSHFVRDFKKTYGLTPSRYRVKTTIFNLTEDEFDLHEDQFDLPECHREGQKENSRSRHK